jgi:hypothetical protein
MCFFINILNIFYFPKLIYFSFQQAKNIKTSGDKAIFTKSFAYISLYIEYNMKKIFTKSGERERYKPNPIYPHKSIG